MVVVVVVVVVLELVVGPVPPVHAAPLIVQFDGSAVPAALKPNDTLAPGATEPLYSRLTNALWLPLLVSSESQ